MTSINLLPWREKARSQQKRLFLALAVGAAFVALIINGIWYSALQGKINHQIQRNHLLQQEADLAQKITTDKKSFADEKDATMKQLHVLQELNNQRFRLVELLNTLPQLLPTGAFIQTIHIKNEAFALQGEAQTDIQVSDFVKRLKKQEGWQQVQLQEMSSTPKNTTAFQITLSPE